MNRTATVSTFDHLQHLTDGRGLFEHARFGEPRPEHGYCLDDVARGLIVTCREPHPTGAVRRLAAGYLDFTLSAVQPDGSCHNRMGSDGDWTDEPSCGDWWGRAAWGLGVAAAQAPESAMRAKALLGMRVLARGRSPYPKAMAFAAIGAGEISAARPDEHCTAALLRDAVEVIGPSGPDPTWPWPEPRLSYGNGSVVEAMLCAGATLPDPVALRRGLDWLDWLLTVETRDGHLSVTPVGGRGPGQDPGEKPELDQQPIEVAALADACARAYDLTGEVRWRDGVRLAWAWFLGDNDNGTVMIDPVTGGGFDGLQPVGCNLNQGAESTLAALSTGQHARRLGVLA